jgi:hypothetical protein
MSSEHRKERNMKKLATIIVTVLGFATLAVAQAAAKPTGMSHAEYQALRLRSQALNQHYGLGAFDPERRALRLRSEGLNRQYGPGDASPVVNAAPVMGENYFARGIPSSTPTTLAAGPSTSTEFQWGDAGIGAGALFGLMAILAGTIGFRRHRLHLGTS